MNYGPKNSPGGVYGIDLTGFANPSHLGAGLDSLKIADGSINNSLFQNIIYLSGTSGNLQTQINSIIAGTSFRGGYDASSNLFPSTGGSGGGGAIKSGDNWVITVPGTLGGTPVIIGTQIIALVNTPGQTAGNWNVPIDQVNSVFGRMGAIIAQIGDYTIAQITNGLSNSLSNGNIFVGNGSSLATGVTPSGELSMTNTGVFTLLNSAVIGKVLTGLIPASGTISATDTILQAFNKTAYYLSNSVSSFNSRTGAVAPTTGDYTIAQITNGLSNALTDAYIFVGNAGIASGVPMSGEASIIDTGVITLSNSAVISKVLTGLSVTNAVVVATDSLLVALGKAQGQINSLSTSSITSVFGRLGPAITAQSGDYSVAQITGAAPLNNPALTGIPTAPTASPGTNTTQLATTAFVAASAAAGVTSFNSRVGAVIPASADYTVNQVTGAAPLASPALTGNPTAPTQIQGDNSTKLATTAYVDTGLATKASTASVALKADIASPTFTGVPAAPTASPGTSTTQLATTAFVAASAAAGVTSFNTRTGAVVPATNDYSFSQISGVVPATQGGTGLSSYVVGDTFSAVAGPFITRIAAVALGSIFSSNGVATLPSWKNTLTLSATTNQITLGTTNILTLTTASLTAPRICTLPDANSNTIQPTTATAGQALSSIDSAGVQNKFAVISSINANSNTAQLIKGTQSIVIDSSVAGTNTILIHMQGATINSSGILPVDTNRAQIGTTGLTITLPLISATSASYGAYYEVVITNLNIATTAVIPQGSDTLNQGAGAVNIVGPYHTVTFYADPANGWLVKTSPAVNQVLTNYLLTSGSVLPSDSIIQGMEKLDGTTGKWGPQQSSFVETSDWVAHDPGNAGAFAAICYSSFWGLGVVVNQTGAGNRVMTSPDGNTWTLRTSAADNTWTSVCVSDSGFFVAVSSTGVGNRVMTSPNGITWTIRTSAADNSWNSVCWSRALNLYIAVANSGVGNRVMTSPDGITWTIRTSAADNNWIGVVASDNIIVAVSTSGVGNRVMTSPDGITWTIRTSAADNGWTSVCWASRLNLFVAVSNSGVGNHVMTSPDGITWTIRTSAADNQWQSVCYSPQFNLLVAVANSGVGNRIMTSRDGITWATRVSVADNSWRGVVPFTEMGKIVAISDSGTLQANRTMSSMSAWNYGYNPRSALSTAVSTTLASYQTMCIVSATAQTIKLPTSNASGVIPATTLFVIIFPANVTSPGTVGVTTGDSLNGVVNGTFAAPAGLGNPNPVRAMSTGSGWYTC